MGDYQTASGRTRLKIPLGIRLMVVVMRFLAHGRCYHCRDAWSFNPVNRCGLRYCADFEACGRRMAAQGKRPVSAGQRALFWEVPRG